MTHREALGLKIGQFVGLMDDQQRGAGDEALAQREAERHMERVIERLKRLKGA